jgi:hypothetical protein
VFSPRDSCSCRSASSSTNKFTVSVSLSFFALLSNSFFYAAFLDLSHNLFNGTLPSELGNLLKLGECIDRVFRICGFASTSTNNLAVFGSLSFVCLVYPFLFVCSASLNLLGNSFYGNLPSELGFLTSLALVDLSKFLSVPIITKWVLSLTSSLSIVLRQV